MTTTIHRQIGKMGKRSADDASVAMIIKDVNDAETVLAKLIEHTKAWRDAWSDIFVNQVNLTDSFHDVYKTIPMPGDSEITPMETPKATLRRVAKLHAAQNDLKADMTEEIEKVDQLLIARLSEAKAALKPIKKAIDKRENKKLDYERFNKQVENSRAKKNKSDRDYTVLSKVELDLEKAKNAYENADNHLKSWVPDLLAKIFEFLPCIVEFIVQSQYMLLQNTYSAIYEYAQSHSFVDPEGEIVISEWEDIFLPVKQQLESEITSIARGKAVTLPMNIVVQEKSFVPRIGRGNKPPPPPPPANPPGRGGRSPTTERSSVGGKIGNKSFSSSRDNDDPPVVPSSKPSIRSRASNSNLSVRSHEGRMSVRDESPPPPLPGPRPSMNDPRRNTSTDGKPPEDYRSIHKSRSYGSATPLAGAAQKHAQNAAETQVANYLSPSQRSDTSRRRSVGLSNGSELNDRLASIRAKSAGSNDSELDDRLANIRAKPAGLNSSELDDRLAAVRRNQASIERTVSAGNYSATGANNRSGNIPKPLISRSVTGTSMASFKSAVSPTSNGSSVLAGIAGKKKPPPPPPPKKTGAKKETWVRALFTFSGQDNGDLSFREGERILVVKMTESTDDWWEGELNGRKGQFPANYTEIVT